MSEALQVLNSLEPIYQPSTTAAEAIGDKNLIAFIGAFAVGKTTLIEAVAASNPDYTEVISFTTRPSRGEGDRYRFIDYSDTSLEMLALQAQEGRLVNFTVHPTTGYVYGTEPSDYKSRNCMLATTAKSFETDKLLPFATVKPVVVVAEPHAWLRRIDARAASIKERQARVDEARQSLEWSLNTDGVLFIDNTPCSIALTARTLVQLLEDSDPRPNANYRIAAAMLSACNE